MSRCFDRRVHCSTMNGTLVIVLILTVVALVIVSVIIFARDKIDPP
jgi:hypothetical protein